MKGLKKICFVRVTQRCFNSEDFPSDFSVNVSSISQKTTGFQYIEKTTSPPKREDQVQFQRLQLTVIEAEGLEVGSAFLIDPDGLRTSNRCIRDGRTYAGYDEHSNDILLPRNEFGIGRIHFVVEFNSMSCQYLIKDEGDGTGTFVKLSRPLVLQSYYILSFGSTHMTVVMSRKGKEEKLTVKFIEGPKAGQSFVFGEGEDQIKIGRMPDCAVKFDDTSLSRYQCTINYKQKVGWVISDGDGSKPSTNGTWLFLDDYFPIETDMVLKAGMTLFRVRSK
jgi:pSer/pThr/pTyr-binding forkhead associated (FHA) protein